MAVAHPAVKPSTAAGIVDLALYYLCLVIWCFVIWCLVIIAGFTATIVARRACPEGSIPLVFLEEFSELFTDAAIKFSTWIICLFLAFVLCGVCLLVYLVALESGSGSESKKSAFGAIKHGAVPKLLRAMVLECVADLPRALLLGILADLALILLAAAGNLVEGSISQGDFSVIEDVALVGIGAIFCFVVFPSFALYVWRKTGCGLLRHITWTEGVKKCLADTRGLAEDYGC